MLTQQTHNVVTTSLQRHDVAATLYDVDAGSCVSWAPVSTHHYENTPIQIYWKFYNKKKKEKVSDKKIKKKKKSDIFIFILNIDCGYSLEPPRRGGSNEYPQSMFF